MYLNQSEQLYTRTLTMNT